VLGQQVSLAAARRLAARLVALCATPLPASVDVAGFCDPGDRGTDADGPPVVGGVTVGDAPGGLTHVFPDVATIAGLDPATLPMPLARGRALVTLASALASGDISLDPGADREEAGARLVALPGIGPWTAGYIRMRALSDPDVFLPGDVGVVRALRGLTGSLSAAERWRPWRSYATHHLWAALESGQDLTRGATDEAVPARTVNDIVNSF
jgi:AraC family transcriptional regulator of adaptative response / DNA-3-methyladenine glycosylase II